MIPNQNKGTQRVDVCVIGLGVSSLALVRQLEQVNASYVVVSETDFGVWEAVARRGDDFDMSSSSAVSSFSWWKTLDEEDLFFSANDYYARLKADIAGEIEQCIVRERAMSYVEQADGTYAVYTHEGPAQAGPRIICKHLVITAGLSTDSHSILDMLERSLRIQDKTVFIDGYGDTTLMLMSRLMLGNNRVIIGTSHFQNLNKVVTAVPQIGYAPSDATDPHEHWHFNNHEIAYGNWSHSAVSPYSRFWLSGMFRKKAGIDDLLSVEDYMRDDIPTPVQGLLTRKGAFAGFGFPAKYWPVEAYFSFCDNGRKEHMLNHRMLLNDPYYFMQLGLVQVVHSKRIEWITNTECLIDDKAVAVDEKFVVKPAMPRPVQIERKDGQGWTYDYRSCLHGIWSAEQPNLYFLGAERPTSGSFAATGEMQCAFVYRLITDKAFRHEMVDQYEKNLQSWQHNYLNSGIGSAELLHAQFAGATNQALARLLGVQRKLWPSLLQGKLFEYLAGTCIPARYDDLTHVGKEYSQYCRKWINPVGPLVLVRSTYVYLFAANLVALGLFAGSIWVLILGLLLFVPIIQKLIKCLVYDTISYGLLSGSFNHLAFIFLICLSINLVGFVMGVNLEGVSWGWIALLTGLPLAFVATIIDIIRSYRNDKLPLNDIRDNHQFLNRFPAYLADVKETAWYKRYTQEECEQREPVL
ncbi:MAG: hypothetical protein AAF702_37950 [Chloroflexota bacterium]